MEINITGGSTYEEFPMLYLMVKAKTKISCAVDEENNEKNYIWKVKDLNVKKKNYFGNFEAVKR